MSKIRAIVVDDELHARNVIRRLIEKSEIEVDIKGSFSNLVDAVTYLKNNSAEVVFLDIQMPGKAGYEIVNYIDKINFEIVFVTAYDHYAIKAFELSAIDYLVKPVNRTRFYETLKRVSQKFELANSHYEYKLLLENFESKNKKLVIPEIDKKRVIDLKDILCIQGQGSYSKIYIIGGNSIVTSKNLKRLEQLLPENHLFFRSQRSWLINTSHVTSYNTKSQYIELNNTQTVRLSPNKVSSFEAMLQNNSTK